MAATDAIYRNIINANASAQTRTDLLLIFQSWLTAKVLALIAYIGFGAIALKYGKSKTVRVCALVSALTVILYIAAVAVTKRVLVFV